MAPFVVLVRLVLSAIAGILAIVSGVAWSRRRRAPEARIVSLLVAAAAIYCFGYAQEVAQTSLDSAVFWLHVEYFGIPWIPALWVLLARKHNGLRSDLGLIFPIPLLVFVAQLTNSMHGLYDRAMWMTSRPPFMVVSVDRGPIAWLNLIYLFVALPYGAWIILDKPRSTSRRRRIQTWILAGSGLIPFFGYFLYLVGWSPWGLDMAPVMLGASVFLAYYAVFKLQLFDLVPTAHSLVFNSMREAVLVTDLAHRLVEFNPAAGELLPRLKRARTGDDVATVLSDLAGVEDVFRESAVPREIDVRVGGIVQYFELRVLPLRVDDQQLGWTAILANVTAQRRLLEDLRRDAETDELTAVANRRSFLAAAERESSRSDRYHTPFSVMLVDLDYLKIINDRFGHAAGDKALCTIADRILECLRTSDVLSRYGGDEFAILLPETNPGAALEVAERIRHIAITSPVEHEGNNIELSISIGIASHDPSSRADFKQLLEHADRALYDAKAQGRNRVVAWQGVAAQRD